MSKKDPAPIPRWLQDHDEAAPCPCGRPIDEDCIPVEGDAELTRWMHEECLPFLRHEMNEEEIEYMERWQKGEIDD